MRRIAFLSLLIASLDAARIASAQLQVPFFDRSGTAFDPEISIVNTGVVADMQGIVSNDMKYVTINARPSASRLIAIQPFAFQQPGNLGFVGSVSGSLPAASILVRPGMTRLNP